MNRPITILLADDHALVRETLASYLRISPDFRVVAAVGEADAAVAEAIRHHPDIVLLDIDMPGLCVFEAARRIRVRCPDARIVFLSAFSRDHYIAQALAVEASGYLTKAQDSESLVRALRRVASGQACFSPEVEGRIVVGASGMRLGGAQDRRATLSSRELEVIGYLARGLSKKETAALMRLSERTVNRHCTNLMGKLDLHDRVDLARYAIREGLVEP